MSKKEREICEFHVDVKNFFVCALIYELFLLKSQASVVQTLDSDIHWINRYPADKYYGNQLRYPLDRFLSDGYPGDL